MKYLLFSALSLIATLAINAQSQTFKYDRVGDFKEGMAQVFVGSKFGFIDISGKEVIPPIYEDNFPHYEFKDGFIVLKKDNLLGIVDKTGKVIKADYTQKGSTTTDSELKDIARKAALQFKFTLSEIEEQCGTITVDFKIKSS